MPLLPSPYKAGDSPTLAHENAIRDAIAAGVLDVDVSTGLRLVRTGSGFVLRLERPRDGWFRITGAGSTAGSYTLVRQVETANGGWADGPGPKTVTAFEANKNAAVPIGSGSNPTIVRATFQRGQWRFAWGKCS